LVLGGTRFLGPPIVQRLVEGGHEVTVFHRGEREPVIAGDVQHVHGAFSQLPDFVSRLSRRRPEVVLDV
jgi:nucleoside-diphosphate-sugar epimerase